MEKSILFIIVCLAMILAWSIWVITHWFDAVDYDLVRDSFETLRDHSDLWEVLQECNVEQVYWHWDTELLVAIQQDCWKTILVDVLTEYPSYERVNSDEIWFYSMS